MEAMTSRMRLNAALNHQEGDMIPIDFGGMRSTGISAVAYDNLKKFLGMHSGDVKVYDLFQQLAEPEESILEVMGGDVVQLHRMEPSFGIPLIPWKEGRLTNGEPCLVPSAFDPRLNERGQQEIWADEKLLGRMPSSGLYFENMDFPFAHCETKGDIDKVGFGIISGEELAHLKKEGKRLHDETEYGILASFGGNIFEAGQNHFGIEKYLMDLYINPSLIQYYHEKLTESYLESLKLYLEAVGDYINVIQFGDDLGNQNSSMISPDMYRKLIKPWHKIQFQYVKKHYPHIKVFLHSCGAVFDLIPDLIDAGVEVLNPIQLSAAKMKPKELKNEFGKDLTFWGGGLDTQSTLTFGSISDIEREVEENMTIFAPGGGFVFTQVHNIQANIAPEKILAMYKTAKKFRDYK